MKTVSTLLLSIFCSLAFAKAGAITLQMQAPTRAVVKISGIQARQEYAYSSSATYSARVSVSDTSRAVRFLAQVTMKFDGRDFTVAKICVSNESCHVSETDFPVEKIDPRRANNPPQWERELINLGQINVGGQLDKEVKELAYDEDDDKPLRFATSSSPRWVGLTLQGRIFGVPKKLDIGPFAAVILVYDGKQSSEATVIGEVTANGISNTAPAWKSNSVDLGVLSASQKYQFNLAKRASDSDKDELRFELTSGPEWLKLDKEGRLTIDPEAAPATAGEFEAEVRVTDGMDSDMTSLQLKVVDAKPGRPYWTQTKLDLGRVEAGGKLTFDLDSISQEPDGDEKHFSIVVSPAWIRIKPGTSTLELNPPRTTNSGTITAVVEVSDGATSAKLMVVGRVEGVAPPKPKKQPEDEKKKKPSGGETHRDDLG